MMLELLGGIRTLVRVRDGADVESAVFKLHYSITTTMLFGFCVLVTCASLVGDPINCLHDNDPRLKDKVVNTYCWIHTTFTLPKYLNQASNEKYSHLYPGIGASSDSDEKIYHAYYQWVPFTLFIQAMFFYIPHWIWRSWEGKKISSLVEGLTSPLVAAATRKERITLLADYLASSLRSHNLYTIKFLACELLNVINSIMNICFLNKLMGGNFYSYGSEVLWFTQQNQEDRTDPMIRVFPRITKCTFHLYGPSGTIEKKDFMCVLAMNIINEKIYVFLWFWFIFLAVISSLALIYRAVVLFTPNIRIGLLHRKAKFQHKQVGQLLANKLSMGDFFVLHLIGKNMEIFAFCSLIHAFYDRLDKGRRACPPDIDPPPPDHFGLLNSSV